MEPLARCPKCNEPDVDYDSAKVASHDHQRTPYPPPPAPNSYTVRKLADTVFDDHCCWVAQHIMVCNSCQYVLAEGQLVDGFGYGIVETPQNWVHADDDGRTLGRVRLEGGPGVGKYTAQQRKVRACQN